MNKLVIIVALFFLNSCASPFAKFYNDLTAGKNVTTLPDLIVPSGPPKIYQGRDLELDAQNMMENGYYLLGYSSFNSAATKTKGAEKQGVKVQAEVVIVYSRYTNTVSGYVPLTLPNTQRSTTTMSGRAYGSGGYASASGRADTTTYGSSTTYIPYNVNRFDYVASYWIKVKTTILGVVINNLPQDIRDKIGSNKGALVVAVLNGSPAFFADILKGDIIKKVGDIEIYDSKSTYEATSQYAGKTVNVVLLRNNETITKEITLNNKPE